MRAHHCLGLFIVACAVVFAWPCPRAAQAQDATQPAFTTAVDVGRLSYLTDQERAKLAANGFVICIRPGESARREVSQMYLESTGSRFPVFVTGDAMLHTWHLLSDWSLRFLEASSLRQDLTNLTDALLTQSLTDDDNIPDAAPALKQAAMKNAVFFNVAKCLLADATLEGVPAETRAIIEKELALINAHEGFAASPLFGYTEDYSQYVPRGHYARSEELSRYFKAMIWYGRMGFHLSPVKEVGGKVVVDGQAGAGETLQALLVCRALAEAKVKGETAADVWKRIYETTAYFAGRSDDLTVQDYAAVMKQVYGPEPPPADLAEPGKLADFLAKARQLPKPAILSTLVTNVASGQVDWRTQEQAMRFMGQRFTPDGHIFQNLVYDRVTAYRGGEPKPFTAVEANGACFRGWPRGLDIMAVFGSDLAGEILKAEGDTNYEGYDARMDELKRLYGREPSPGTWDQYTHRLNALRALLSAAEPNAPAFMRTKAWREKQLNAALGSWTELKHDTIVYSKQPYGMMQAAMAGKGGWFRSLPAEVVRGYVEPVPRLYARIRESVAQLRGKYDELGFPKDAALQRNFQQFENLLAGLEAIAGKELAGQPLTEREYQTIEQIGGHLAGIVRYGHYIDVHERFASEVDNEMAVVADVYTQPNEKRVLEEGVGLPAEIFVIAPVDGKDKVCRGVAYAYYEFKQPMSDRLADEKWREILIQSKQPPQPTWLQNIAVTTQEE